MEGEIKGGMKQEEKLRFLSTGCSPLKCIQFDFLDVKLLCLYVQHTMYMALAHVCTCAQPVGIASGCCKSSKL